MAVTDAKKTLLNLIEQEADVDLVREMLAFAADRIMELEIEVRTVASPGVRTPERTNQRNGYRERAWDTRAGRIELAIPRLRKGSYFPSFLEPRRTAEKALAAVIQDRNAKVVNGMVYMIDLQVDLRRTAGCLELPHQAAENFSARSSGG